MIYLEENGWVENLRYIQKCSVAGNIWRNFNWMSVPLEVVTLSFKTERITSLVERPFPGQNRLQHSLQLKDSWRKTSVNDFMSKDCKLFSQMSQKLPQHTWWDSSLWNITLLKDAEEEPSIKISSAYVPSGTLRYLWAGGPCIANQLYSLCPSFYPFELSDYHFLDGPTSYLIWSKHCFSLKCNQAFRIFYCWTWGMISDLKWCTPWWQWEARRCRPSSTSCPSPQTSTTPLYFLPAPLPLPLLWTLWALWAPAPATQLGTF